MLIAMGFLLGKCSFGEIRFDNDQYLSYVSMCYILEQILWSVIGTVDDEWMSCIDAITFIFQARTTAINNEKKGIKKKP
jgi:hypothetical protein